MILLLLSDWKYIYMRERCNFLSVDLYLLNRFFIRFVKQQNHDSVMHTHTQTHIMRLWFIAFLKFNEFPACVWALEKFNCMHFTRWWTAHHTSNHRWYPYVCFLVEKENRMKKLARKFPKENCSCSVFLLADCNYAVLFVRFVFFLLSFSVCTDHLQNGWPNQLIEIRNFMFYSRDVSHFFSDIINAWRAMKSWCLCFFYDFNWPIAWKEC